MGRDLDTTTATIPRRHWGDKILKLAGLLLLLQAAGCSIGPSVTDVRDGPPLHPIDISKIPDATPKHEPLSKYGNPVSYSVNGKRYYTLKSGVGYEQQGIASWYGTKFHGQRTSSGEPYDMYAMTAAHRSLPLPTYARVTNLHNERTVVVKINDRGPFHSNRIIDLSYAAAAKLDILGNGTGLVKVQALDPVKSVESDKRSLNGFTANPNLYIQIGAFGNRFNAQQLQRRLQEALSDNIRIQAAGAFGRKLYRVQVGPVSSVEKADTLTVQLALLGIKDTHIVID